MNKGVFQYRRGHIRNTIRRYLIDHFTIDSIDLSKMIKQSRVCASKHLSAMFRRTKELRKIGISETGRNCKPTLYVRNH